MKTTRRAFMGVGGASALAMTLAACSQNQKKTTKAKTSSTPVAEPVLSEEQLTKVLERIQTGMDAADKDRNAEALKGYLAGPAARVRQAEYSLASTSGDASYVHTFSTTSGAGAVGLTLDFPRNAVTVTEASPQYLLTLQQGTARDNFELWAWVQLFAGAEVPAIATASKGAEQVAADSTGLVATPKEVLDAYVDALNNPEGDNGKAFADDALRQKVQADRAIDLGGFGTVTVTAAAGADGFQGLRTADGGAIIVTTLTYASLYQRTVDGSDLTLQGAVAIPLGGNAKLVGTITATYDIMIAFSVPPEGSGQKAVALGAEAVLSKVDRDDSQAPAPTATARPS